MPGPSLSVRVAGTWLSSRAAFGDLTLSWSWPGGSREASWQMTTRYGARLPTVVRGAYTEVLWGGWPIWTGSLQEPDWNGHEASVTAAGLVRQGERYRSLDPSNVPTDIASTAVDNAIVRGMQWVRSASVPTTALPLEAGSTSSVTELLDKAAEKATQRWGVDAFGNCYFATDPTAATYHVTPGSGDLGIADDAYASNVVLYYLSATSALVEAAIYPPFGTVSAYETKYGHSEFERDITDRGAIADAAADLLAQAVYERTRQRPGWTNGLELAHGEVRNEGGQPAHPLWVAADGYGKLMRLHGVPDEVALTPYTGFVVGGTSYAEGSGVVNVDPVGLVSRTQEDVLTELLEAMNPPEAA